MLIRKSALDGAVEQSHVAPSATATPPPLKPGVPFDEAGGSTLGGKRRSFDKILDAGGKQRSLTKILLSFRGKSSSSRRGSKSTNASTFDFSSGSTLHLSSSALSLADLYEQQQSSMKRYQEGGKEGRPKSCMKVSTQAESLRLAEENARRLSRKAKEARRASKKAAEATPNHRSVMKSMKSMRSSFGLSTRSRRSFADDAAADLDGEREEEAGNDPKKRSSTMRSIGRSFQKSFRNMLSHRDLGASIEKSKRHLDIPDDMLDEEEEASRVKFDSLTFRWYVIEATDNPCATGGVAMGCGWAYEDDESPTSIDLHEEYRATEEGKRTPYKELRLTAAQREEKLLQNGASREEIAAMRKSNNIASNRRKRTLELQRNMHHHEKLEGMVRKLKKVVGLKRKYEEEERELWERAQLPAQ